MAVFACPECGLGIQGTLKGKIRKHNRSIKKFDTCPASGLTADEYNARTRLEYLREQIRAERIGYYEWAELQSLAQHIEPGDTELLEWAGVPEASES